MFDTYLSLAIDNGFYSDAVDSLCSHLEYDEDKKKWFYPRGDYSGRDFFTLIPIQFCDEYELEIMGEWLFDEDVENYDWGGYDLDNIISCLSDELLDYVIDHELLTV